MVYVVTVVIPRIFLKSVDIPARNEGQSITQAYPINKSTLP